MIVQFYFAIGVWGSARHVPPAGKNKSHSVGSLVMIGCVIRPEEKTR